MPRLYSPEMRSLVSPGVAVAAVASALLSITGRAAAEDASPFSLDSEGKIPSRLCLALPLETM